MNSVGQIRTPATRVGLSSAIQARQSWRPPAVRAATALMAGITRFAAPPMLHWPRLSAWQEQFTQRAHLMPGWLPLALTFRAASLPVAQAAIHRRASVAGQQSPVAPPSQTWPFLSFSHFSRLEPIMRNTPMFAPLLTTPQVLPARQERSGVRTIFPPLPIHRDGSRDLFAATKTAMTNQSEPEPGFSGAGWRPVFAAEKADSPQGGYAPLRTWPSTAYNHFLWRPLLSTDETLAPRLVMSASKSPRQEIRGGFPILQPAPSNLPETLQARAQFAGETRPFDGNDVHRPFVATQAAPMEHIEKHIEPTLLPVAWPAREFRQAPAEKPHAEIKPAPDSVARQQMKAERTIAPLPPTPLDINAVADKVYQTLMHRHQLERERRGRY